jgi:uncharacterized membrane protein YphA (DoxX/SURF4 family)
MKRLFENRYFVIALRILLGALFMYASFDKMANPEAFADIIDNYHLLPVQLVNPLAIFLPWLEFITGLFLVTGKWTKGSLIIYTSLLVIFIIALSQALIRGLDISCGCFSVNPSSTSEVWLRIIEDIFMLAGSIMLYRYYPDEINITSVREKETSINLN